MDIKNASISAVAITCIIIISFFIYQKYSTITVEYTGLGQSANETKLEVKKDIVINDQKSDSDTIEFTQRKISGGGVNPGWVISLIETQPNVFTGRVIVDDGVYQHPVTLKEEVTNIFVGDMKSKDGKREVFSLKKIATQCTDDENNLYEYSLTGFYGATQFSGCGGEVLRIASI